VQSGVAANDRQSNNDTFDNNTCQKPEGNEMPTFQKSSRRFVAVVTAYAMAASLAPVGLIAPAQSAPLSPGFSNLQVGDAPALVPVRFVAHGGRAVVGPRGGAVVRRGAVAGGPRGGAAVRRTAVMGPRGNVAVVNRRGGWARPGRYRWPVGGAIAAGAAMGFVAAATAAAWAGAPPSPGLCWYYTDPSRTQGFWDYCPQ
jgi:hypothetical protein